MKKINQEEYKFLKSIDDKYKWIARDEDGVTETLDTGQGGGRGHYTMEEPKLEVVANTSKTGHNSQKVYDEGGLMATIQARDYKGPKQVMVREGLGPHIVDTPFIVDAQGRLNKKLKPMNVSPTLRAQSHGNEPKVVEGIPIREATKQGYAVAKEGDSINLQFPDSKARRGRVGNQIANTLQAGETNQGVVDIEAQTFRIRKLTPLECFRLQGFPDELFYKAQEVNSNSQLYKQAGNSVTVNVIKVIAGRLV